MAEGYRKLKTEHAGAKNGGGYWGLRTDAKRMSRHVRRYRDHLEEREGEEDYWGSLDDPGSGQSGTDERDVHDESWRRDPRGPHG